MSDALHKRNIAALHANSKLLQAQIGELRDVVSKATAQISQLRNDVLQLRQQTILNATSVGGGPTIGNNG